MTIDDQIKDGKFNMILIEKLEKHQPYHQAKLYVYLTSEEILPSNKK